MSEAFNTADEQTPGRGRLPRADAEGAQRRRRNAGSLNRMVSFKLDIFSPDQLDLANYVYLWANDEGTNIRQLTRGDDYEFVTTDEIVGGFDVADTDSESTDRIRILVGNQKSGAPMYAYYLKKPRAFWEADNEEIVRTREDMMAGRVYRAEATDESEARPGGADNFYATPGNVIGGTTQRRRRSGPVPRTLT